MRFACDVFVSFDAGDDRSSRAGSPGWVATVRRGLELRLTSLCGARPVVRSSADAGANPSDAATFVCIVSPAAISSAQCTAQRDSFVAAATNDSPAAERMFKVMVQPVPRENQPPVLRDLLQYELPAPQVSAAGDEPRDDRRFWTVIDDLAHAIADVLRRYRGADVHDFATAGSKTIFIAETSADMQEERDRMRRELQRHGHVILPSNALSSSLKEMEQTVKADLAQSVLSIHLIGAQYGAVPRDGSSESTIAIQHRLALDECRRNPDFHHLIWIPPAIVSADDRQRAFLSALRNYSDVGHGTELVQTTLEDFKTLVEDKLRPAPHSAETSTAPRASVKQPAASGTSVSMSRSGNEPQIYLMFDQQDRDTVAPLQEYVNQRGLRVITSTFEGDQTTLRQIHQDNLKNCDAALIVYGRVREPWVRIKQQDLLKAAGFGRTAQMLAKAIYVCPEVNESKRQFRAQEVMVIKDFESASPSSLQPFLDKILASQEGTAA